MTLVKIQHGIPPTKRAWVTLLTKSSYLPGAVLLAYSLHQHNSQYPLIVLTTPSFPSESLPALDQELALTNAFRLEIPYLSPPPQNSPESLIASRFADTWTKLRAFELYKYGYGRLVFLDADMLVLQNMDELFDTDLPRDWIAANHACICNSDGDKWAPEDWTKENCAYTPLGKGSKPPPVLRDRKQLLNGGMFVFTTFEEQWDDMLEFLNTNEIVKSFMFPDQDLLAEFFKGKWRTVGWQYNALKTMRYRHDSMWDDAKVKNLHYIVDKPWSCRVGDDGVAGYLGRDGVTHAWWWDAYSKWERSRIEETKSDILETVREEVASPLQNGQKSSSVHGNWQATK